MVANPDNIGHSAKNKNTLGTSLSLHIMSNTAQISFASTGGEMAITFSGTWHITNSLPNVSPLLAALQEPHIKKALFLGKDLEDWDSSLLALMVRLVHFMREQNIILDATQLPHGLQKLLDMAFRVPKQEDMQRSMQPRSLFQRFSDYTDKVHNDIHNFLEFFGEISQGMGRVLRGKSDMRAQDVWAAVEECGAKSLVIVSITSLLFGLILAFVGAIQLTQFGAQRFVAPLVGIGMLRVMGAIMVGIVMSGRIGAAYAALIGTMQVNEEVDALKTLGFSSVDFLVLPRIFALVCMAPLLTLYADLMGIFGGFLVGVLMLNLSPQEYFSATMAYVPIIHLFIGLVYGTVFGAIIAIAGCYQGIRCGRSAEAVGQATTAAVVNSIVGIIVATAIITIICNRLAI